jgi:hypothetical protein
MGRIRVLPVAVVALGAVAAAVVIAANGATVKNAAAEPPFYGVGLSEPATSADYARMAAGGVRTGRFVIDWRQVQLRPGGGYHWRLADRYMRGLAKHGLEPLPLLFGTPGWVAQLHPPTALLAQGAERVARFRPRCRRPLRARRQVLEGEPHDPLRPGPLLADLERAELAGLLGARAVAAVPTRSS